MLRFCYLSVTDDANISFGVYLYWLRERDCSQSKERNEMYEVNVRWIGSQQYVAEGHEGRHAILLDIPEKSGGTDMGLHATELFLIAVGKCSAVDVVNILKKQRVDLKSLRAVVSGEITRDYPKHFEKIHVKFIVSGGGVTKEKVEKAVHLSHEKYCSVSLSLTEKCDLTTSVEVLP
jgi:putative redox protein